MFDDVTRLQTERYTALATTYRSFSGRDLDAVSLLSFWVVLVGVCNTELGEHISQAYSTAFCYQSKEARADVADVVVSMQTLDVNLNGLRCCLWVPEKRCQPLFDHKKLCAWCRLRPYLSWLSTSVRAFSASSI